MVEGWRYYNHAMLPTCAPHEEPNMEPLDNNTMFAYKYTRGGGHPLLARWTSDFDCGYETEWWYCIKDTPFDVNAINSKKRYEINKGRKNFDVRVITPADFSSELYECTVAAYTSWPKSYRPSVSEEDFLASVNAWSKDDNTVILGAFKREDNRLVGYALLEYHQEYVNFSMLRVKPECEKSAINAALVAGVCELCDDKIATGMYLVDGERSILHETHFQEYLEKYFGFRKAYCLLNLKYNGLFGTFVRALYPVRSVVYRMSSSRLFRKVGSILYMEEIVREQRKKCSTGVRV